MNGNNKINAKCLIIFFLLSFVFKVQGSGVQGSGFKVQGLEVQVHVQSEPLMHKFNELKCNEGYPQQS
jgi:hypothetical protein